MQIYSRPIIGKGAANGVADKFEITVHLTLFWDPDDTLWSTAVVRANGMIIHSLVLVMFDRITRRVPPPRWPVRRAAETRPSHVVRPVVTPNCRSAPGHWRSAVAGTDDRWWPTDGGRSASRWPESAVCRGRCPWRWCWPSCRTTAAAVQSQSPALVPARQSTLLHSPSYLINQFLSLNMCFRE